MNTPHSDAPHHDGGDTASPSRPLLSRRTFAGGAAATAAGITLLGRWAAPASAEGAVTSARAGRPGTSTFGSVSTAPRLPHGFAKTFRSRFIDANGIRQHVVIGGDGPPLLLIHGWPENWYAWRHVMPALARDFTVIAVDQRGIGLSEKAVDGYDTANLANDLVALMDELGHERFAVVGHDTGYIISYTLAADHPDRVDRLVVAEIPGPPGTGPDMVQPRLFLGEVDNNRLWHIPFNRVNDELIIDMVSRSADAYYRYEYAVQGGGATLPEYAIKYYVKLFTRDRDVLRASFGLYHTWDAHIAQNVVRQATQLTIPVLGIGGANSWINLPGDAMRGLATDVQTVIIPDAGHWVAEQAPEPMLAAMSTFLAPYLVAATT